MELPSVHNKNKSVNLSENLSIISKFPSCKDSKPNLWHNKGILPCCANECWGIKKKAYLCMQMESCRRSRSISKADKELKAKQTPDSNTSIFISPLTPPARSHTLTRECFTMATVTFHLTWSHGSYTACT